MGKFLVNRQVFVSGAKRMRFIWDYSVIGRSTFRPWYSKGTAASSASPEDFASHIMINSLGRVIFSQIQKELIFLNKVIQSIALNFINQIPLGLLNSRLQ